MTISYTFFLLLALQSARTNRSSPGRSGVALFYCPGRRGAGHDNLGTTSALTGCWLGVGAPQGVRAGGHQGL